MEAGLWQPREQPEGCHWGWESPTCQLRGHFLGHWLSAAAKLVAASGDAEVKAKADRIVAELGRCQAENGGECAGSIPPAYLDWTARGKRVWAPHYTVHKTLMGLVYFEHDEGLVICQYVLSEARWEHAGSAVTVTQTPDSQGSATRWPRSLALTIAVSCARPAEFTLALRLPWWLRGEPAIAVNGVRVRSVRAVQLLQHPPHLARRHYLAHAA